MENKKITVIIAIYNVAEYLTQCLNSVINQTYTNLEIICVDDGSTDNSGEICDKFAKRDNRILVIHKENGGVSSAKNAGLDIFTGDYVSIIDGDDWLDADIYSKLVSLIESENDVDISSCGYFIDYPNLSKCVNNENIVPETSISILDFLIFIYQRDKYKGVGSYTWNKLLKSNFFKEINKISAIRFNEDLNVGEDVLLTAECYLRTRKIIHTSKPYYHYRQREASAMHSNNVRLQKLSSCLAYERVIDLYEYNNINETVLDYVKRFYVYHASVLLEMACKINDKEKIDALKLKIIKYLDIYIRTNKEYPERIERINTLLI